MSTYFVFCFLWPILFLLLCGYLTSRFWNPDVLEKSAKWLYSLCFHPTHVAATSGNLRYESLSRQYCSLGTNWWWWEHTSLYLVCMELKLKLTHKLQIAIALIWRQHFLQCVYKWAGLYQFNARCSKGSPKVTVLGSLKTLGWTPSEINPSFEEINPVLQAHQNTQIYWNIFKTWKYPKILTIKVGL